jgi:hypothetical protein
MFMNPISLFFVVAGASAAPPAAVGAAPDPKAVEVMQSILSDNATFVASKSKEFFAAVN